MSLSTGNSVPSAKTTNSFVKKAFRGSFPFLMAWVARWRRCMTAFFDLASFRFDVASGGGVGWGTCAGVGSGAQSIGSLLMQSSDSGRYSSARRGSEFVTDQAYLPTFILLLLLHVCQGYVLNICETPATIYRTSCRFDGAFLELGLYEGWPISVFTDRTAEHPHTLRYSLTILILRFQLSSVYILVVFILAENGECRAL